MASFHVMEPMKGFWHYRYKRGDGKILAGDIHIAQIALCDSTTPTDNRFVGWKRQDGRITPLMGGVSKDTQEIWMVSTDENDKISAKLFNGHPDQWSIVALKTDFSAQRVKNALWDAKYKLPEQLIKNVQGRWRWIPGTPIWITGLSPVDFSFVHCYDNLGEFEFLSPQTSAYGVVDSDRRAVFDFNGRLKRIQIKVEGNKSYLVLDGQHVAVKFADLPPP